MSACGEPMPCPLDSTASPHPARGVLAGSKWVQLLGSGINTSNGPSGRTQPAMAYDPEVHAVVLFGGYDPRVAADGDTWLFANGTWTDDTANLTTLPAARWGASMVWDAADDYLLLFGGRDVSVFYNDTWAFTGTAWEQLSPTTSPAARSMSQMVYDPTSQDVVLFGGGVQNYPSGTFNAGYIYNDTWTYHAGVWTNVTSSVSGTQVPRKGGGAIYDPWNRSVVAVGGELSTAGSCASTAPVSTFASDRWWSYPAAQGPQGMTQGMLAYDPAGPFVLYFGGSTTLSSSNCPQDNQTWARVNGVWTNLTPGLPTAPSPRYLSGIAFDSVDCEVLLFGGNSQGSYVGDTWVFRVGHLAVCLQAEPPAGESTYPINFTASLTGGTAPYTYNWSFGDGGTGSTGPDASHAYAHVGNYTVRLNVTDSASARATGNLSVSVAPGLATRAQATPSGGPAPLRVNLSGTPVFGVAPYTSSWAFGDGSPATSGNATWHTYSATGNYTATYTVVDADGRTNTTRVPIVVTAALGEQSGAGPQVGEVPLTVNFSATGTGGAPPYSYRWFFGDGTNGTQPSIAHTFTAVGRYTVHLVVTDLRGRTANASYVINVLRDLTANVTANASLGVAPLFVTFSGTPGGGLAPYNLTWGFGDGSGPAWGPIAFHEFSAKGNFTVHLVVTDAQGAERNASYAIRVLEDLAVAVSATPTLGEAPQIVAFTANPRGGLAPYSYTWSFGDGTSASGNSTAVHRYLRTGAFTARLLATDAANEIVTAEVNLSVAAPVALAATGPSAPVLLGSSIALDARARDGVPPYAFGWTGLPAGCAGTDQDALNCTPTVNGTFTVTASVVDALGRAAFSNVTVSVVSPSVPGTAHGHTSSNAGLNDLLIGVVAVGLVGGSITTVLLFRRGSRRGGGSSEGAVPTEDRAEPELESPGAP